MFSLKEYQNKAILLLLFFACLPYLYLSFFAHPFLDDFVFAAQFQKTKYFNLIINNYVNWNGRYISNFLIYLNPLSFNTFLSYSFFPLINLTLTFLATLYLINAFFEEHTKKISLVFTLVLLILYPNISEEIYWFTGAVIYHFGIILTMVYLGLLVRFVTQKYFVSKIIHQSMMLFLLFLVLGFNETLTVLLLFYGVLGSVFAYKHRLLSRNFLWVQIICLLTFSLLLILSPGNNAREAVYINNHNLWHSILYSGLQTIRFSIKWIFSPVLITSSALLLAFYSSFKVRFSIKKYFNKWISLALVFSPIFIASFLPYWATGILGQHRTINTALFFFLIFWFINLIFWFEYLKLNTPLIKVVTKTQKFITVLFLLSLFLTGNGYNSLSDIFSGKAHLFKKQAIKRHQQLITAKEKKSKQVVLLPITAKPRCLYLLEISSNPNYWTNQCYNTYYQIKGDIYVKEE